MNNNENRIEYIDIYRGIGIVLMVLGHMKFEFNYAYSAFYHIIHAFHMPMFFFISGYCYKRKDLSVLVQMKYMSRKLLLPYVVFGTGQFLLWRIFEGDSIDPLIHLYTVNTEGLAIAGALWFLTALFISNILYIIIDRSIKNCFIKTAIVIAISVTGCFLSHMHPFRLPLAFDAAMVGTGFFHLGKVLNDNQNTKVVCRVLKLRLWECVLASFVIGFVILQSNEINMRTGKYGNPVLFFFNAICAIVILISFSKIIESMTNTIALYIKRELIAIGQNGIVYVCINQLIITVVARIMTKWNILQLIVVFILLKICSYVIMHTKLRFFAGKT